MTIQTTQTGEIRQNILTDQWVIYSPQRLHDRLSDPDYSYVIHSCSRQHSIVPYLHWYPQIRSHLAPPSGFEIGSGMHANTSFPERDAEILREEE